MPDTPTTTAWTSSKETYQAGLRSLFAGRPEDTEADVSKLFSPTSPSHTQTDGDGVRDFARFVKHMGWLREIRNGAQTDVTIYQFVRGGRDIADRHGGPDERTSETETFMFGEVAEDGRVEWIKEGVVRRLGVERKVPRY